jgi:hypothetical protein
MLASAGRDRDRIACVTTRMFAPRSRTVHR